MATPSMPAPGAGSAPPLPFTVPPLNDQAALLRGGAPAIRRAQPPPDYYGTLQSEPGAQQLLKDVRRMCESGRELFERDWWRTLLYFFGRQWIYYDSTQREWVDRRLAQWIPKPVTNKVREAYDSIASLMAEIEIGINGRPNGNSPVNQITADLMSNLVPALADEHKMKSAVLPTSDFFAILLGNAFLQPCWDQDQPTHTVEDKVWACQACQQEATSTQIREARNTCPSCGSQTALLPAVDSASGRQRTEMVTIGAGKTIVASPLEILFPLYAQSFDAVDRLIYQTWLPKHEIEDLAPTTAARVNWTHSPSSRSLQLYRAIGYQSDLPSQVQGSTLQAASSDWQIEGATVQYLWIQACKRYPQGVYLPFIGEGDSALPAWELIAPSTGSGEGQGTPGAGALGKPVIPYTTKQNRPIWPWVHVPYKPIGGRMLAQGACDAALPKQDQINQVDSMTDLTAKRMGNPVWLEEKGSQVERYTGMPGMVVKWSRVGQNGGEPKKIDGSNPPQSFFTLRQQYLGDFEESTGTYDVVKGTKPSGVAAYSALQLLVERSQSRFNTAFKARGEAYRQWAIVAFELERKYGPTERIRNVMGPNRRWVEHVFQQTDMQGAITLVVEDGSTTPKTALAKRAALEHANQMGLLDFTQPDQRHAALTLIGAPELVPNLDADVMSALQEQQSVTEWAGKGFGGGDILSMPFARMPWHDDATHFAEHRKWMNGDEAREILANATEMDPSGALGQAIVDAWGQHLAIHEEMMLKRMIAQSLASSSGPTMAGGGAGRGSDGGGVGAGRAMHDSNRQAADGSGTSSAVA